MTNYYKHTRILKALKKKVSATITEKVTFDEFYEVKEIVRNNKNARLFIESMDNNKVGLILEIKA